jgi:hypothetical protein
LNKKFIAEVLKLVPEFSVVDHYFYETPVGHILYGFAAERPPSGAYFWRYVFPLYDRSQHLHLGFGDRLPPPDDFMEATRGSEKAVAAEFVRRILKYRSEQASLARLDRFAEYLETEVGLENPVTRRGYAVTLIMLGRADDAMNELKTLSSLDWVQRKPESISDISKLLGDLSAGIEVAQETLAGWELETKQRLGLS